MYIYFAVYHLPNVYIIIQAKQAKTECSTSEFTEGHRTCNMCPTTNIKNRTVQNIVMC